MSETQRFIPPEAALAEGFGVPVFDYRDLGFLQVFVDGVEVKTARGYSIPQGKVWHTGGYGLAETTGVVTVRPRFPDGGRSGIGGTEPSA